MVISILHFVCGGHSLIIFFITHLRQKCVKEKITNECCRQHVAWAASVKHKENDLLKMYAFI